MYFFTRKIFFQFANQFGLMAFSCGSLQAIAITSKYWKYFKAKKEQNVLKIPPHLFSKYMAMDIKLKTRNTIKKYSPRPVFHKNELAVQLQGTGSHQFSRLRHFNSSREIRENH